MTITCKAMPRNSSTKGDRRKLREEGKVPAVVYGKKVSRASIMVDQKELLQLMKTNLRGVIEMDVPEHGLQHVMISDVQRDKLSRSLLHVDFHQINMDEPVNATVRLEYVGEAKGVSEGGILQIQLHDLDVRCLPHLIPSAMQVDVTNLEVGGTLLVSDLQFAEGVEVKNDAADVLVTVLLPQKEAEPSQVDTAPAAKVEGAFEKKGEQAAETV